MILNDCYEQDIQINVGATQSLTLTNWQTDGVTVDLTGASAVLEFRRSYTGPVLLQLTSPAGGITLSAGQVACVLSKTQTALLTGRGVYNLKVTFADTTLRRLVKGTWEALP